MNFIISMDGCLLVAYVERVFRVIHFTMIATEAEKNVIMKSIDAVGQNEPIRYQNESK